MTEERPRTRQELYQRIQEIGRESFIIEEMIRYGFWPETGTLPEDPADEIRRREALYRELNELYSQNRILHNEALLKKQQLQERLAESKRKRQETKERREKERQEKAAIWQAKKEHDIIYLGEDVSKGLNYNEINQEKLTSYNLPILSHAEEIAQAMEINLGELRFLAFHRPISTVCHYTRFKIPKKTGGERLISAPKPRLKKVQTWILTNILEKVELNDASHGFRKGKSIVSNAGPHVGQDVVINLDLKDFFPSISYPRVKGLFQSFGYGEQVATILALLCTEADIEEVELDGKTYYVHLTDRHLPQGSPASPAISNILCRNLDRKLTMMAEELGFVYTRYADDLTFSASGENLRHICNILRRTEAIVKYEGLTINEEKTRIMRKKSSQMEVTGIVVNSKPNIDRKELKKFRTLLFQIERDGLEGKSWGNSNDLLASIQGYANYVAMVNPEKGAEFQAKIKIIREKYRHQ